MALPNEGDLAREFGVSAGTMRKALGLLEIEHLVTRRQGRGTFVNDPSTEELADRFYRVVGENGERVAARVEANGILSAEATEKERERLRIDAGEMVWRRKRVRYDRTVPFMYEEVSLPASLFPDLDESSPSRIVILSQQHGLLLGKATERLVIGSATAAAAEALQIEPGSGVVVLDRVVHTIDGLPVEWRVAQCRLAMQYMAHMG